MTLPWESLSPRAARLADSTVLRLHAVRILWRAEPGLGTGGEQHAPAPAPAGRGRRQVANEPSPAQTRSPVLPARVRPSLQACDPPTLVPARAALSRQSRQPPHEAGARSCLPSVLQPHMLSIGTRAAPCVVPTRSAALSAKARLASGPSLLPRTRESQGCAMNRAVVPLSSAQLPPLLPPPPPAPPLACLCIAWKRTRRDT